MHENPIHAGGDSAARERLSEVAYAGALANAMTAVQEAVTALPRGYVDRDRHGRDLVNMRRDLTELWLEVVDSTSPPGAGQ